MQGKRFLKSKLRYFVVFLKTQEYLVSGIQCTVTVICNCKTAWHIGTTGTLEQQVREQEHYLALEGFAGADSTFWMITMNSTMVLIISDGNSLTSM